MRMKYSSHEGRTFLRVSWEFEVSIAGSLKGSIKPVSSVAETGDDERAIVQLGVYGSGVEVHVRMLTRDALHARHSRDGVEARDPGRPLLFELVYRCREAPPRREHRVEDENKILLQIARQVDVVLDRQGRLLVSLKAHEADRRRRQQGECPVEHTEACAQYGDEADRTGDFLHLRLRQRGANLDRPGRHTPGGFCDHDEGELLHGLPEVRGPRTLVAQDGELVPAQGSVNDVEVLQVGSDLTHRAGKRL